MGVLGQEEWAGDALPRTVFHNRLGDGEDMPFIERGLEARSPVPGGAEGHALRGIVQVRRHVEVRVKKSGDVYKVLGKGNCARTASHWPSMPDPHASLQEMTLNCAL